LKPLGLAEARTTADRLIDHFGSLRATIAARPRELLRASGGRKEVVEQLAATRQAMLWSLRQAASERPYLGNMEAIRDYLRMAQGFAALEEVRVLHLDSQARLLREELMSRGTPDEAVVNVREIIAHAVEIGSVFLVLVHNHPSGDPTPSERDRELTRRLSIAAHSLDMRLIDHLIVAERGCFSFRDSGLV
jgi:DNA repair protein RadC